MSFRDYETFSREEQIGLLKDRDANEAEGRRPHYKGQSPPRSLRSAALPKIEQELSLSSDTVSADRMLRKCCRKNFSL